MSASPTRDDLLERTRELMLEAGESGVPLLEGGLQILMRATRFSLPVKALLLALGQLVMTICEELAGDRGRRGEVGERRKNWLKK
jgi:hypothetical protein